MPPPLTLTPQGMFAASDNASELGSAAQRFPHIRAQLSAIYQQHKGPLESCEDTEDELTRITTSLVTKVASLLGDEREDELKMLLKTSLGVDDDTVCGSLMHSVSSSDRLCQLEQHVLDLMHRHRDDVTGVPFLFLTPTRRPISRPSSKIGRAHV